MGKTSVENCRRSALATPTARPQFFPLKNMARPATAKTRNFTSRSLSSLRRVQPDSNLRKTPSPPAFSSGHLLGTGRNASRRSGIDGDAKKAATAEFTDYGDERFAWFWKAGHDWIPDFDNGGSGMITLQLMLMQCDGKRIQLLPAWPAGWNGGFQTARALRDNRGRPCGKGQSYEI